MCRPLFVQLTVTFSLVCSSLTYGEESLPPLHPLFSDHMVVQRDTPIRVWGWVAPGEEVAATMSGQARIANADADGLWQVEFGPFEAGGPVMLEVIRGDANVIIQDIWIGDVWLCSGQSNMYWPVKKSNDAEQEITAANHPQMRLFSVPKKIAATPQSAVDASWQVCSPETVENFSAVAYFFGRALQSELNVPIGLIHSSWGGTVAEAWVSAESLRGMEDFQHAVATASNDIERELTGDEQPSNSMDAWWNASASPRLAGKWRMTDFDDASWKSCRLPGRWESSTPELKDFDGVMRYRRTFEWPADAGTDGATLSLAKIDNIDDTWVNGHKVGSTKEYNQPREYQIPAAHLHPGENVVSVRVLDTGGGGGFHGESAAMAVYQGTDTRVSLAGEWHYETGQALDRLPKLPTTKRRPNPNVVTALSNAMIEPLTNFKIRGAIWYQGESNARRPAQYRPLLETLIADWRRRFQSPEMPFFIVQLANFKSRQTKPVESGSWAEIRDSQQRVADGDPHVGIAIITDIGEANDIHPRNKQEVGKRLALSALHTAYGQELVHSGPTYAGHKVDGESIRITFDDIGSGLKARGDELRGFAIASDEGDFVWAEATIEGTLRHRHVARDSRARPRPLQLGR